MASKTFTTVAEIVGHDRLSGVFAGMSAKVQAQQARITKSFADMNAKLNSLPIVGGALGGALAVRNVFGDEVAWSKQVQLFKAISGIGEDWGALEKTIYDVSNATSESREKVLGTAKAWVELGGSVKSINKDLLMTYTNFSRLAEIDTKSAMKESRAFGIAYKMDVNDPKVMKQIEDLLITAVKRTPGGGEALMEYLKKAAPVGGTMHIPQHQLLALGTMMMREGFQGGDAGRAVNTGLLRMVTQSKEIRRELEAANVKVQDMYDTPFRAGGMIDTMGLRRRLEGGGYMTPAANAAIQRFEKKMGAITEEQVNSGDFDLDKPIRELKMELAKDLKRKGLNPDTTSKLVDQQVAASMGNLDLDKTLDTLGKLTLTARAKLLGKEHFPKWEPLVQNRKMLKEIEDMYAPDKVKGALDRMTAELNQGFGFQFTRFTNIMRNSFLNIFGSGDKSVSKDLGNIFKWLGDLMMKSQKASPEAFRAVFWGLTSLAALPVGVFAIKAVAGALGAVTVAFLGAAKVLGKWTSLAFVANGIGKGFMGIRAAAAAGIIGTIALGSRLAFLAPVMARAGRIAGILGGAAMFAGKALRFTAIGAAAYGLFELFKDPAGTMKSIEAFFASEPMKKLGGALMGLGGSFMTLFNSVDGLVGRILEAFGLKIEGSGIQFALLWLIDKLGDVVKKTAEAVEWLAKLFNTRQEDMPGAGTPPIKWDQVGDGQADQPGTLGELQDYGQKTLDWFKSWFTQPEKFGPPVPFGMQPDGTFAIPGLSLDERAPTAPGATPQSRDRPFSSAPPLGFKPFGPSDRPSISIDPGTVLKATIDGAVPVTLTTTGKVLVEAGPGLIVRENTVGFKAPANAPTPATSTPMAR